MRRLSETSPSRGFRDARPHFRRTLSSARSARRRDCRVRARRRAGAGIGVFSRALRNVPSRASKPRRATRPSVARRDTARTTRRLRAGAQGGRRYGLSTGAHPTAQTCSCPLFERAGCLVHRRGARAVAAACMTLGGRPPLDCNGARRVASSVDTSYGAGVGVAPRTSGSAGDPAGRSEVGGCTRVWGCRRGRAIVKVTTRGARE